MSQWRGSEKDGDETSGRGCGTGGWWESHATARKGIILRMVDNIRQILAVGENVVVEFKRCGNGIKADAYESICAFLNRFGGDVFFGVLNDGTVEGVAPSAAPDLVRNLINNLGNPNLFVPSVHLEPDPKNPVVAAFFRTIGFADELGSGVRKMFKYGKAFAGYNPTLTEDDLFRSELLLGPDIFKPDGKPNVPINVPINEHRGETISETISETIKNNPGISLLELVTKTKKSRSTVARAMAKLRSEGKVEYRGSKKTGGYYLK